MTFHTPVLAKEVLEILAPKSDQTFIDCTLGHGGHTIEILKTKACVYGIDQDFGNLSIATQRISELGLSDKFKTIHGNFRRIKKIHQDYIKKPVDGILFDLGLSQNQITGSNRGFSFNDQSSIDMRLDPKKQKISAEFLVNTASFDELYEIFTKYGQEKFSKPIILRIIRERQKSPIKTATRLADIIRNYYQKNGIKTHIDPATKIFMSLRIVVNREYSNLQSALRQTIDILKPGGKVAIITFHSGEDRIVKHFIQNNSVWLEKLSNPIKPSLEEIRLNPLSRSATLRSYKIK